MFQKADIGIVSIATNSYFDYWKSLVKSAHEAIVVAGALDFYLFTDQPERAQEMVSFSDKFNFHFVKIPSYGWPDATLKRYEIISKNKEILSNNILMYLDSDMLINVDFVGEITSESKLSDMNLVSHPGFYRPPGIGLLIFYFTNPHYLLRDLILRARLGALGAWETNPKSLAYVQRQNRKRYVCGGTWFGNNEKFLEYVQMLSDNVARDEKNSITAIWHDESHLNKIASIYQIRILDSRYCFDPRFANLKSLPNIIEAVYKHGQ
jgi:hypothetical protein